MHSLTLRKQIAFALGPWLLDYLDAHQHRRESRLKPAPRPGQANAAGG